MGASCTPCDSNEHPNAAKSNTQRKRIQYKSMDSEDISDGILPNAVQSSDEIVDCFKAAVKSMDEDLVMHLDQRFPDLNMLDMLLRGETILHLAVKNKKHKLLIYCLENGLDPNMRTALYGDTALHLAVQAKDLRIASILLRYKADPKAMNSDKSIPLDMAEENGDIDMIELLSERTQDAFLETFEHAGTFRTDMNIDFGVDNSHSTPK